MIIRRSLIDRFEKKVLYSSPDGCHYWIGSHYNFRYGRVIIDCKSLLAHRVSYQIYKGEIPNGMNVCHSCDNTLCVNPDHLWIGTQADNMIDKKNKGRAINGNRLKTHCPKGHPYSGYNNRGHRICKICKKK